MSTRKPKKAPAVAASGNAPDAAAFEAAIRANPAELASWAAYADYLAERDDPRGEFAQVQLALENQALPEDQRRELRVRENAMLRTHGAQWLGPLAGGLDHAVFTRGWVTRLEIIASAAELEALAGTTEFRLLRELRAYVVRGFASGTPQAAALDWDPADGLRALAEWPQLEHLRSFQFGQWLDPGHTPGGRSVHLAVARMTGLRELRVVAQDIDAGKLLALPLSRLRLLSLNCESPFDPAPLGANPALAGLERLDLALPRLNSHAITALLGAVCRSPHLRGLRHLRLTGTNVDVPAVTEIVASGVLRRLRSLELPDTVMGDLEAEVLAGCPDLAGLDHLDLSDNWFSVDCERLLRACRVDMNLDRDDPVGG